MQQLSVILQICRFTLSGLWIYQGLFPKLLGPHKDEITLNSYVALSWLPAEKISVVAGGLEIIIGIAILLFYRAQILYKLTIFLLVALLAFVSLFHAGFLIGAFNPVVMNLAMIAIALIAVQCLSEDSSEWHFK